MSAVPRSLTAAEGFVGVGCRYCTAEPGERCAQAGESWLAVRDGGEPCAPHADRQHDAYAAAWWHCFGDWRADQ